MKIKGINLKEHMKILQKSLIFLLLAAAFILPANAALQAAGPISTVHGFPVFYQDTTGLALQPCLGVNGDGTGLADPNCVVLADATFNPVLPVSFPTNFPGEFFYYIADADAPKIGPAQVTLAFRYALEGSFGTGAPLINDQIVFLRVNVRVSQVGGTHGLIPNSSYVFTHPLGTFTCTTNLAGDITQCTDANGVGTTAGQEYRREDGAFAPPLTNITAASFLAAPLTAFGPFLKAVAPAPPAGYIGNPAIAQTIQAGRNGAALVITGPSIDPLNADGLGDVNSLTVNTWFVAGKIAVIDTVPPVIVAARPPLVVLGATNVILNADITDNLGVFGVTVDLGPLGNNLTATLSGAQEVPPTTSTATGSGTFTIDTVANTLSFNINAVGVTDATDPTITGFHFHGSTIPPGGAKGFNAPVVFDIGANFGTAFPVTGVWTYPEAMEPEILAGRTYVNIHTTLFPTGKIRGQILPSANVQNMALTAGNATSGTWGIVIPSVTRAGTFILPISATDGSNTTTLNHTFTVTNLPTVTAVPNRIVANVSTPVTITVTQGALLKPNATVNLTGAVLPAPLTGITDANGTAVFTVNATAPGPITVTANHADFVNPGTATITVGAPLAPLVATFDTSGDGFIQRNEAVACVVQFFTGTPAPIPRSTAVAVVVAFFTG